MLVIYRVYIVERKNIDSANNYKTELMAPGVPLTAYKSPYKQYTVKDLVRHVSS